MEPVYQCLAVLFYFVAWLLSNTAWIVEAVAGTLADIGDVFQCGSWASSRPPPPPAKGGEEKGH